MGRLENQRGIIKRKLMPRQVMHWPMKLRISIGFHRWRGSGKRQLTNGSITVSLFYHFNFVFLALLQHIVLAI